MGLGVSNGPAIHDGKKFCRSFDLDVLRMRSNTQSKDDEKVNRSFHDAYAPRISRRRYERSKYMNTDEIAERAVSHYSTRTS